MVGRAVKTVILLYNYEASSRVVGFIVAILKSLKWMSFWFQSEHGTSMKSGQKLIINRLPSTGHSRLSW